MDSEFENIIYRDCDRGFVCTYSRLKLPCGSVGARRGNINCFSSASCRRLREALVSSFLDDSELLGITLTLPFQPWHFLDDDDVYSFYSASFNRFTLSFRRHFPNSAAIFRHELQRRSLPHCHLVCYLSGKDGISAAEFKQRIFLDWHYSLSVDRSVDSSVCEGWVLHGVNMVALDGSPQAFRYLAGHSSKHKQAQLGFRGKQWGYINRKVLKRDFVEYQNVPYDVHILMQRYLRKLSRFSVPCDCVFGSHKVHIKKFSKVRFIDRATRERLVKKFFIF